MADSGEPERLAPMSPFERKVVHDAVAAGRRRPQRERGRRASASRRGAPRLSEPTPAGVSAASPSRMSARRLRQLFGDAAAAALRYAELLVDDGSCAGCSGPREAERIWDRHLLNSAVARGADPATARASSTSAAAPGCRASRWRSPARPARCVLLEPLARRCAFLEEVVDELGSGDRVTVMRGRAPDVQRGASSLFWRISRSLGLSHRWSGSCRGRCQWFSRAAHCSRCAESAPKQELQEAGPGLARYGGGASEVVELGGDLLGTPVRVVRVPRTASRSTKGRVRVAGVNRGEVRPMFHVKQRTLTQASGTDVSRETSAPPGRSSGPPRPGSSPSPTRRAASARPPPP